MIILADYLAQLKADPFNTDINQKVSFQLMQNDQSFWDGNRDKHANFRQEVTRLLYQNFSIEDRQLILMLLEQETLNCKFIKNSSDNLLRLLFMLYTFKQAEDLELLHSTKFGLGYNATLNIDINLLFGLGPEAILAIDNTLQKYLDYKEVLSPEEFSQQQKTLWDQDIADNPVPRQLIPDEVPEEKNQLQFFFNKGDVLVFEYENKKIGSLLVAQSYETFDDAEYIVYPSGVYQDNQELPQDHFPIYGRKIKAIHMGNPFEQSITSEATEASLEKSRNTMLVSITITHSGLQYFQDKLKVVGSIPSIIYKGTHHLARVNNWKNLEMHLSNLNQGNYPGFETVDAYDFLQE
ncbi:MAG TPA: hypothetical protein DCS93_41075 [Microscillaceae bacterium]|nr:hypothetical protein [Microscillaceae bacterium]